jgi:hypothetical protein
MILIRKLNYDINLINLITILFSYLNYDTGTATQLNVDVAKLVTK